jgi:hypothetical protein
MLTGLSLCVSASSSSNLPHRAYIPDRRYSISPICFRAVLNRDVLIVAAFSCISSPTCRQPVAFVIQRCRYPIYPRCVPLSRPKEKRVRRISSAHAPAFCRSHRQISLSTNPLPQSDCVLCQQIAFQSHFMCDHHILCATINVAKCGVEELEYPTFSVPIAAIRIA